MCNLNVKEIEVKLKQPFERKDVEFRIAKVNKKTRKAYVVAYISSRAAMDRLDAVFGQDGWFDEYEVLKNGVSCRLSVKFNGEFITKQDAAPFTNIEALKGAFSDALKRVAVKFGIGRYLYKLPDSYVTIKEKKPTNTTNKIHCYHSEDLSGYWEEPDLPDWALTSSKGNSSKGAVGESTGKGKTVDNNIPHVKLLKQLDDLFENGVIPKKKCDECRQKINDPATGPGLIRYFEKQFGLLSRLNSLTKLNKFSQEEKNYYYNKIISSKMKGLSVLENELKKLEAA